MAVLEEVSNQQGGRLPHDAIIRGGPAATHHVPEGRGAAGPAELHVTCLRDLQACQREWLRGAREATLDEAQRRRRTHW